MLKEAHGLAGRLSSSVVIMESEVPKAEAFERMGLGWRDWAAWSVATVSLGYQVVLHMSMLKTTTEVEAAGAEETRQASS